MLREAESRACATLETVSLKKLVDLYQASSLKGSTSTMISSSLKPGTNAYTVCGRPTLIVCERFMKDSFRGPYERFNLPAKISE